MKKKVKQVITKPDKLISVPGPYMIQNNVKKLYWKQKLKEIGWPDKTNFNFDYGHLFGSCRYSTAYEIYKLYFEIRKDLNYHDTFEVLEIKIDFDKRVDQQTYFFKSDFENYIKQLYKEYSENEKKRDGKITYFTDEKIQNDAMKARRCRSFDDMMCVFRSFAWDLWKAAPTACKLALTNFSLKEVPKSPGKGPKCNVSAQSVNFKTGICCALLKDFGFVKNELSFSGFDT